MNVSFEAAEAWAGRRFRRGVVLGMLTGAAIMVWSMVITVMVGQ
jgi:hypothetical protein